MLLELNINNFAIIEDMNVKFTKGLNVLTGETGSGKSIIIEALGIILGGRGTRNLIQSGKERALLQALFVVDNKRTGRILSKYGIEVEEDKLLLFTREISKDSPSISRINGVTVTLSVLRELSTSLIDIFAQKEHQSLLDVNNHRRIIDSFGDSEHLELLEMISKNYFEYNKLKTKLETIDMDPIQREREMEFLKFQLVEITEANLSLEDDDKLEDDYNKINNISNIEDGVNSVIRYLNSDDFERVSILDLLNKSVSILEKTVEMDVNLKVILDRIKDINFEMQDINIELNTYINSIDLNEEKLFLLRNRIDTVNGLKKKYGNSVEDILLYKETIEDELEVLSNYDKEVDQLAKSLEKSEKALVDLSKKLSKKRKKISEFLEEEISKELLELNMDGIRFKVKIDQIENPSINGMDRVEFLISTNIGEDLKPLSDIVSGGEMSRIMLAFKNILAEYDEIPTMVFDEIDAGISGRTAQIVGEKIAKIAKKHQVIAITHLPQITALADSHYLIDKKSSDNRVISNVYKLDEEEKVLELARLLGGVNVTQTTINHAKEMITMSREFKKL